MAGFVVDNRGLRGIGAASATTAFQKASYDVDGPEAFAAGFTLNERDGEGRPFELAITPEFYAQGCRLSLRRNVHGAVFFNATNTPELWWLAVWCYGFGKSGPHRRELDLPTGAGELKVNIKTCARRRDQR